MRFIPLGALPCLLFVQAAAQSQPQNQPQNQPQAQAETPAPLNYADIQSKARPAPEQGRAEALLAERQLQSREARGFLREGPSVALMAGPRRTPGLGTTNDKSFEVDLPLFLSPGVRACLETSLGKAHPILLEAARREGRLQLRAAYLDAWLAARLVELREADLATVERWREAAQARLATGADPAYQLSLVEGEQLKVQQEVDEARTQQARAWGVLVALAEVPLHPVPLADPEAPARVPTEGLGQRMQESPMRKAILAQADLEARGIQLREAQALSRWSLRGSYASEGEERVARVGVAVRLPRPGEGPALKRHTEAQLRVVQSETRRALAELDARAESVLDRMNRTMATLAIPDFRSSLEAIGLRLREGKERPSDALPIRRQLLESQMASLRRTHAQHLLVAELQTLLPEVNP